jgi:hypothetical protein
MARLLLSSPPRQNLLMRKSAGQGTPCRTPRELSSFHLRKVERARRVRQCGSARSLSDMRRDFSERRPGTSLAVDHSLRKAHTLDELERQSQKLGWPIPYTEDESRHLAKRVGLFAQCQTIDCRCDCSKPRRLEEYKSCQAKMKSARLQSGSMPG